MNSNNKKIIIGVGIGALLAILFIAGRPGTSSPGPNDNLLGNTNDSLDDGAVASSGAQLSAPEMFYDFGSVSMRKGLVNHRFAVKNETGAPVVIGKMYTSCMCTTASLIKNGKKIGPFGMPGHGFIPRLGETIAPGEAAVIEVVFDPAAHGPAGIGRIERAITLEQDSGGTLTLQFRAEVTP